MTLPTRLFAALAIGCMLSGCAIPSFRERKPRTDCPVKPAIPKKRPGAALAAMLEKEPALTLPIPLRCFAVNHIWGGQIGYHAALPYRAKISLWGAGSHEVAELYFYDTTDRVPMNPDSTQFIYQDPEKLLHPYYVLNFPMTALGPILEQLRHTPADLTLNYYDKEWAIVAASNEPVMKPVAPSKKR